MISIADRLAVVKPSASMAVSLAAKDLAATGGDVIDLGSGPQRSDCSHRGGDRQTRTIGGQSDGETLQSYPDHRCRRAPR